MARPSRPRSRWKRSEGKRQSLRSLESMGSLLPRSDGGELGLWLRCLPFFPRARQKAKRNAQSSRKNFFGRSAGSRLRTTGSKKNLKSSARDEACLDRTQAREISG